MAEEVGGPDGTDVEGTPGASHARPVPSLGEARRRTRSWTTVSSRPTAPGSRPEGVCSARGQVRQSRAVRRSALERGAGTVVSALTTVRAIHCRRGWSESLSEQTAWLPISVCSCALHSGT